MYIAYTNMWTEGVAVIKDDDLRFPMGYDGAGGTSYCNDLDLILEKSTVIKTTNDIYEAVQYDTAGYTRYPRNLREGNLYNELLAKEWSKPTAKVL